MRIVDLGRTGKDCSTDDPVWADLSLPSKWRTVIDEIAPNTKPHDIQIKALRECKLLQSRRHLVISGPTNSGKSLLGYLAIFSGLTEGRRALLIEPFRALAQEKFDELTRLVPRLKTVLQISPAIEITTGDYRITGETFLSDPPKHGEIVIATPERIDVIMRNPDYDKWISSFGVICVDEAHIIGDEKRGPTLESVITRFLCEKAPPRVILLSATMNSGDTVLEWLHPCDIAASDIRRPPLQQRILIMDETDKADDIVLSEVQDLLPDADASALVFVYKTTDSERLALTLSEKLKEKLGDSEIAAYHSKMPTDKKTAIRAKCDSGQIRCLISTTALGAGVNLPATHVIVRDLTFGLESSLSIWELLQMMGRAGRGTRQGVASIILKKHDYWEEAQLTEQIKNPVLPELRSALTPQDCMGYRGAQTGDQGIRVADLVLGQLVRREHQTIDEVKNFFDHSLGGKDIRDNFDSALRWLCDNQRILAWTQDNILGATALGKAVARTALPLEVGTGLGSLVRDILSVDTEDKILSNWKPLDTLIVLELLNPREKGLKRFSKDMAEQVEDWIERSQAKSVLFTDWIRGAKGFSKADQVFGSLGIMIDAKRDRSEASRQSAYTATLRAILIYQLGNGALPNDVEKRWKITGLDGVQERWRDHLLWQLSGVAEIFDVRCFYHFLKTDCNANDTRINQVKNCLKSMVHGIYDLMGMLRFCSPLGPVFRDLEAAKAGVGIRTKEKLEKAGVTSLMEINQMRIEDIIGIGIRNDIAGKLKEYCRRRSF